jgi:hypothetical protein
MAWVITAIATAAGVSTFTMSWVITAIALLLRLEQYRLEVNTSLARPKRLS